MAVMGSTTQKQLTLFISFFTLLFCIVIAFDIIPFFRGPAPYPPDWQWEYVFTNTIHKIWVPIFFMGVSMMYAYFLEKKI